VAFDSSGGLSVVTDEAALVLHHGEREEGEVGTKEGEKGRG
jgi:hypothetical protein